MPIRIATIKRCLNMIFSDKASLVDPTDYSVYSWLEWVELDTDGDEHVLTTTRSDVKIPEVVVLAKYDKVFTKDLRLTKRNIYIRDKYKKLISSDDFEEMDKTEQMEGIYELIEEALRYDNLEMISAYKEEMETRILNRRELYKQVR
jgi:deoxycytidine triphosphate deaminase